jgi:hypothetical protein
MITFLICGKLLWIKIMNMANAINLEDVSGKFDAVDTCNSSNYA